MARNSKGKLAPTSRRSNSGISPSNPHTANQGPIKKSEPRRVSAPKVNRKP